MDKPYTVHARSIDRNGTGQSPSNYKLSLRNAIKCNDDHYIRASSLVSAKVPSTFYQIDSKNNTLKVGFNRSTFTVLQPYLDLPLQDNAGEGTSTRPGITGPRLGVSRVGAYVYGTC